MAWTDVLWERSGGVYHLRRAKAFLARQSVASVAGWRKRAASPACARAISIALSISSSPDPLEGVQESVVVTFHCKLETKSDVVSGELLTQRFIMSGKKAVEA